MIVLGALLAAASPALAQFGTPQPGQRGSTGPFGPAPQPGPYNAPQPVPYGAPQGPYYPQAPYYPQQPYSQPYPTQVQVSMVGVWSTTLHDTQGRPTASILVQFSPDGRFQRRMLVRGGQVDVFGAWQYDVQNAILRTQSQDYAPRTLPPPEQMGQVYTLRVQWVSANHFVTQDASGPIRWVRQQ